MALPSTTERAGMWGLVVVIPWIGGTEGMGETEAGVVLEELGMQKAVWSGPEGWMDGEEMELGCLLTKFGHAKRRRRRR